MIQHQISSKSVQWERRWYVQNSGRTDGRTWRRWQALSRIRERAKYGQKNTIIPNYNKYV